MAIHEVRIFDGEGNLKKIVKPEIDYDHTNWGNSKTRKPFNRIPVEKIDPNVHNKIDREVK